MLLTLQNGWVQDLSGVVWDPHGWGCAQNTKAQVLGSLTLTYPVELESEGTFSYTLFLPGAPCGISSDGGGGGWWYQLR